MVPAVAAVWVSVRTPTNVLPKNGETGVGAVGRMLAMSDLIDRIKSLRYVHVPQASQLFEEAIAEIERLRLTDEEREAIETCILGLVHPDDSNAQNVLRSLLNRTK